jgi:hypothetical protein
MPGWRALESDHAADYRNDEERQRTKVSAHANCVGRVTNTTNEGLVVASVHARNMRAPLRAPPGSVAAWRSTGADVSLLRVPRQLDGEAVSTCLHLMASPRSQRWSGPNGASRVCSKPRML